MSNGLSGILIVLILVGVIFGAGYLTATNDGKTSSAICEAALRQSVTTNATAVPQATRAVELAASVDQLKVKLAAAEQENQDLALKYAVQATRMAEIQDAPIAPTGSAEPAPEYMLLALLIGLASFGIGGIIATLWSGHARKNNPALR